MALEVVPEVLTGGEDVVPVDEVECLLLVLLQQLVVVEHRV